jgi:beta-hydroxylase
MKYAMNSNQTKTQRSLPRRLMTRIGKRFLHWIDRLQIRHSRIPTDPFLDNGLFDWVPRLEAATGEIRAELNAVMQRPEDIPSFHQISPDQERISKGNNWKTFGFFVFGQPVEDNCARCPRTAALLQSLPGLQNAMFSILAPRYHIPPHKGPTRALVRCHLALQVPKDSQNCWIRVDDQIRTWEEGKVLLLDDTYEHEVRNDTDETRVVLFLDFDRPMDRIGNFFNQTVISLIRASSYARKPMKNLKAWSQQGR